MRLWDGLRRVLGLAAPRHRFDSTPRPIDQVIFEMSAKSGRVSRADALSVPAMLRGRNLICSVSTLPIVQLNAKNDRVRNPLLEQLDPDVANVVTLAQTLEDLVFESISWWLVTAQDFAGYPVAVRHLDESSVSLTPPAGRSPAPLPGGHDPRRGAVVYVDGVEVSASRVIRFDSPNPAVLSAAGRAIRRAILMDRLAAVYADNPRPLDYFTPSEGADPLEDDEVADLLAEWKAMRKRNGTGYVNAALKYNSVDSPSPADMQLVELQKQAGLAIANALGVDPEELGISTTSRTYANVVDRRKDRINDVLSPYMLAITQRLSMGDVTRRGNRVEFDLDDYLKSNPTERWGVYEKAINLGVLDEEEVRAEEGLPQRPKPPAPQPPPADASDEADEADETDDGAASPSGQTAAARPNLATPLRPFATFDGPETMSFDVPVHGFNVDMQRRIIEGVALPYGPDQVANKHGLKFRFVRGALQWGSVNRVKLLRDHDMSQPIGVAREVTDLAAGLRVKFRVAKGVEGDTALSLAAEGVMDGLSVGVDFDMATDVHMDDDGVMNVTRADLREVSLTAMPAFDDARVTKVAASLANKGDTTVTAPTTADAAAAAAGSGGTQNQDSQGNQNSQPAPAGLQLNDDQLKALVGNPAALAAIVGLPAQPKPDQQQAQQSFALTSEQINALAAGGHLRALLGIDAPAGQQQGKGDDEPPRQLVDPTRQRGGVALVREALPYRFDRKGNLTRGTQYDFSTDLIAGLRDKDGEALGRAEKFMQAQFAVATTDVNELNPDRQRPDMYVDQKDFAYPIWDSINKGTLEDSTPFVFPKFNSSSGLVGNHTQGTEPTSGTFTSTGQTVTPKAVSGKVEINREAWDQGGNPQLSGLIWRQMTRAWFEALEADAVTLLNGLTLTGGVITITPVAAVDAVLVGQIEKELAKLHFTRGGLRMRDLYIQVDLYTNLVDATDADGRKLLPMLNPFNANGQVTDLFGEILIGGLRGRPAWALAASGSVAANSYLFDRADVHGWATAPTRLTFDMLRVKSIDVGIWGYSATAASDESGVRRFVYDPVL